VTAPAPPDAAAAAFAAPDLARAAWGAAAALAFALAAWRAGSLAASGAAAAVAVGTAAVVGGWRWGGLLIAFFVLASALSRWRRAEKGARTGGVVEKGGRRDAAQVLANGGVFAALAAAGALAAPAPAAAAALAGAAAGALAAAAADTWATEVGTAVGGTPRTLRGWRPVPPGTSGAVTAAGSLALAAGAAATAGTARLLGLPAAAAAGALAGGLAGAWADTLLGAAVQERRYCDRCGEATEQRVHRCGAPTRRRGGLSGLGNDGVNGLCTVAGAAAGALAARLLPAAP
jgi:uncharacterized protein (TIGR00297 family)